MQIPNNPEQHGWWKNDRGGWQPPDEQIDLSEMPEVADFSKAERGPFSEYLKRRRERRKPEKVAKVS
jgi:hypothetical protein